MVENEDFHGHRIPRHHLSLSSQSGAAIVDGAYIFSRGNDWTSQGGGPGDVEVALYVSTQSVTPGDYIIEPIGKELGVYQTLAKAQAVASTF